MDNIPYTVYERSQARHERTVKRLIIAILIAVVLLFASNVAWLIAWCQYDYSSTETSSTESINVDGKDGIANYIGQNGDIINGKDNSKKDNSNEDKDSP